jgi:hypothetical protein
MKINVLNGSPKGELSVSIQLLALGQVIFHP